MPAFELFLLKDSYVADEWAHFAQTVSEHVKGLQPFTLHVVFQENTVRYFLTSKHDLAVLSSGIQGFMITALERKDSHLLHAPQTTYKRGFLKFPAGGSLFDLRERYKVQENQSLERVDIQVQRVGRRLLSKLHVYLRLGNSHMLASQQLTLFPAHLLKVSIEKTLSLLVSEPHNALLEVNGFPYFSRNYYLPLSSFEFDRHALILGQTGSGKSKFIELLINRIHEINMQDYYRMIVIDPHAAIAPELAHIESQQVIDFRAMSSEVFPSTSDATAATELSSALFRSLLGDHYNAHLERTLRYSLFVLYSANQMSFQGLKNFLLELDYRKQILNQLEGRVPHNIIQFFHTDFNDMRTKYYGEAISPLVALVDEMALLPGINQPANVSLSQTIQDKFLTLFSLSKIGMGEKVVKTVAGLIIQNVFQLAQSRVFNRKIILVIDEVSIVQNPTLASILSEARKFNLSVILTQQYLGQVTPELRESIFANTYNYFVFKVSEEDARLFEGNLQIELPAEIMAEAKARGLSEQDIRIKLLTQLNSRECLARVYANGLFYPCIKARTIDVTSVKPKYNGGTV